MQACHPSQVTAYQQELPTVFTSLASRLRGAAKLIPGAAMYHWTPTAVWPGSGRCDTSRRAAWRRGLDGWSVIAARASGVLAGPFLAAGACLATRRRGRGSRGQCSRGNAWPATRRGRRFTGRGSRGSAVVLPGWRRRMRPAHCTRRPLKAIGAARCKVSRAGPAEARP